MAPLLDAVTGATPEAGFTREWVVPAGVRPGKYLVRAEVNQAMDFNETYRKDLPPEDPNYVGASGQPSILWEGVLEIGGPASSTSLKKVGHGQPSGRSAEVYDDLSDLTTALNIIGSIEVRYEPFE